MDTRPVRSTQLSKSRFVAGWQCSKLLWLRTYERHAPELQGDEALRDRLEQGNQVGERARKQFPGGVLVDLEYNHPDREPRTRRLIAAGVPAIFEATFTAENTYAAIDVLLREDAGWTLIEVKSGNHVKPKYLLDAAIQTHVAQRAGVDVRRVEIMHLNGAYVHPGPEDLFVREDVTDQVLGLLRDIPGQIQEQLRVLAGDQPDVAIGPFCRNDPDCPFMSRCWPREADSVLNLHGMRYEQRFDLYNGGTQSITALPLALKLNAVQVRQRRSWATGSLIVEPSLHKELEPYTGVLGFLDFESVGRAIPVWDGTKPWEQIGVQFSYHEGKLGGPYRHEEFLAEPDTDPREEIARRLVEVTRGADHVIMYTAFEKTQIGKMQRFLPALAEDLERLKGKLLDLKQVVHRSIYHPDFAGSFSIKDILEPLVGISYKDTVAITGGGEASAKLARLLFYTGTLTPDEREALKRNLLQYCKLDTRAMVKLLERLKELAKAG
jgi:predicted RecB family nuclease